MKWSRRSLLKSSGAAALAAASSPLVHALQALSNRPNRQSESPGLMSLMSASPYGPIKPARDETTGLELLQLPEGFSYMSFSWTGDLMSNGQPVPRGHDGMGVVTVRKGSQGEEIVLIRNHELAAGTLIKAPAVYDKAVLENGAQSAGGNTTVHFPRNRNGEIRTEASLGGTLSNCAGGVTPWGTWLSCEETVADNSSLGGSRHGYVFEVSPDPLLTTALPIIAMGRFKHEAAAVDPRTSFVYLTEDNRNLSPIYRFIPDDVSQRLRSLEKGGRLQAAKVKSVSQANLLTPALGDQYELEWVDIEDPDMTPVENLSGPYIQARAAGALTLSRGEGIWYGEGVLYIVDTSAGVDSEGNSGHGNGAVWMLDPVSNRLRCIFSSPDAVIGNNPDNITVSPRGGVVVSEDGGGVEDEFGFGERVLGLTPAGESFIFARNNIVLDDAQATASGKSVLAGDYRDREIAGVCFDSTGEYLFFNIQTPGVTFAVWGPWEKGPL